MIFPQPGQIYDCFRTDPAKHLSRVVALAVPFNARVIPVQALDDSWGGTVDWWTLLDPHGVTAHDLAKAETIMARLQETQP